MTVLVVNFVNNDWDSKRFGRCHILVGIDNTPYNENVTNCSGDIFDTGFYQMSQPCAGEVIVIRRDGKPSHNDIKFHITELRVY